MDNQSNTLELKKPSFHRTISSPESNFSIAIGSDFTPPPDPRPLHTKIWDSFKRDPDRTPITHPAIFSTDGKGFDAHDAAQRTADSPLARKLKGRHLQMIAIGGSIGWSPLFESFLVVLEVSLAGRQGGRGSTLY